MANVDVAIITAELIKLRKSDITDLLVKQTLPEGVSNEILINFVKNLTGAKAHACEQCISANILGGDLVSPDNGNVIGKLSVEVDHFKEIIKQNERIIYNQQIAITSLQEHNKLLNDLLCKRLEAPGPSGDNTNCVPVVPPVIQSKNQANPELSIPSRTVSATPGPSGKNSKTVPKSQLITQKQVSSALHEIQTRDKCHELISLYKDKDSEDAQQWETVSSRRGQRGQRGARSVMIGTGITAGNSTSSVALRAVPALRYYHVYRLDPSITSDILCKNLKHKFPEVTCTQLDSKFPDEYSSFKVGICENNTDKFLDPSS